MARKKVEIIDDKGDVMSPPEPGTDAAHVIYLLEYGRKRGFQIGPMLKIGAIELQVHDTRQANQLAQAQRAGTAPDLTAGSDMHTLLGNEVGEGDE